MGILDRFFNQKPEKNGNKNQDALVCLTALGFEIDRIRKALVDLNGIRISELAREHGIALPTFYAQIKRPSNEGAIRVLCTELGLKTDELFPELSR